MSETTTGGIRSTKIEPADLQSNGYERVTGLKIWVSGVVAEVWANGRESFVLGFPDDEDAGHNCDYMGCGWYHVLVRIRDEEEDGKGTDDQEG